jgi:hypothetical protein
MEKYTRSLTARTVAGLVARIVGGIIIAGVIAFFFGFVVVWLWNWLMPDIFGLTKITFWQAWGLVVLTHILFKSFPHPNHHRREEQWKRHFREKCFRAKEEEVKQEAAEPEQ